MLGGIHDKLVICTYHCSFYVNYRLRLKKQSRLSVNDWLLKPDRAGQNICGVLQDLALDLFDGNFTGVNAQQNWFMSSSRSSCKPARELARACARALQLEVGEKKFTVSSPFVTLQVLL